MSHPRSLSKLCPLFFAICFNFNCVYVCAHMCKCPWRPEVSDTPGDGVIGGWLSGLHLRASVKAHPKSKVREVSASPKSGLEGGQEDDSESELHGFLPLFIYYCLSEGNRPGWGGSAGPGPCYTRLQPELGAQNPGRGRRKELTPWF